MFKIGDLVTFNIVQNDSCQASECFGFDPSCGNDWFDIQVYVDTFYGEVVKNGVIEKIYSNGNRSGKFYKISKGIIKGQLELLVELKKSYGLTLKTIFDGSGLKTLKQFCEIKKISKIQLTQERMNIHCTTLPKKSGKYSIWETNGSLGRRFVCFCVFDGKWNIEIKENYTWELRLDRVYLQGKIYVEIY